MVDITGSTKMHLRNSSFRLELKVSMNFKAYKVELLNGENCVREEINYVKITKENPLV